MTMTPLVFLMTMPSYDENTSANIVLQSILEVSNQKSTSTQKGFKPLLLDLKFNPFKNLEQFKCFTFKI